LSALRLRKAADQNLAFAPLSKRNKGKSELQVEKERENCLKGEVKKGVLVKPKVRKAVHQVRPPIRSRRKGFL